MTRKTFWERLEEIAAEQRKIHPDLRALSGVQKNPFNPGTLNYRKLEEEIMTNQPKTLTIDGHTYESIQGHSIRAGDYFIAPGYPPVMTSLPTPPGETAPSGYYRKTSNKCT